MIFFGKIGRFFVHRHKRMFILPSADSSWSNLRNTPVIYRCALHSHRFFANEVAAFAEVFHSADDRFLQQVETIVSSIIQRYKTTYGLDILSTNHNNTKNQDVYSSISVEERETVGIVRHLHKRLQVLEKNEMCRRCWLQQRNCICQSLRPIQLPSYIHRIFLLSHHKEIGMSIDTMKIILCAFPEACRLVVAGLPEQASVLELQLALQAPSTLLLYPYENSPTFAKLYQQRPADADDCTAMRTSTSAASTPFDIVLIDATWEQARRIFHRYLSSSSIQATRVQLSPASLAALPDAGRQLRPHPVPLREIATAQALLLLGQEMGAVLSDAPGMERTWDALLHYQVVASTAVSQ
jgi:DTW domain-containing protein YfiP